MSDYADLETVKSPNMLDIDGSQHDARLDALNASLSRAFEHKVRRRFGNPEADRTVVIPAGAWIPSYVRTWTAYPSLYLDTPLRSLTSLLAGPTWDGDSWENGTTLTITDYRLVVGEDGLTRKIEWLNGLAYPGPWVISGQWADQPDGTVPDDVVEALNVLVAGMFRKDKAEDGEVSGPEGFKFRPANPWNDERVKQAIERYALRSLPV